MTPRRRPMTDAAPSWPATSSDRSPPMTPTASTASPAPPFWARCAARGGPPRWRCRTSAPRSSPPPKNLRPVAPKRPSPSRRVSTPRPDKSTTTRAKPHRLSYGRRIAAERSNATVKDPASNDIARGWCRLMGLTPLTVMLTCLFVVRNQRVLASFEARQTEDQRRRAQGLAPTTRRRRRQTISDLVSAQPPP